MKIKKMCKPVLHHITNYAAILDNSFNIMHFKGYFPVQAVEKPLQLWFDWIFR